MTLGNADENTDVQFSGIVAVAFAESPTFPIGFFSVGNSQAGTRIGPAVGGSQADVQFNSMSGSASFTVPAGDGDTVPLTVWILYNSSAPLLVGGVNLSGVVPGAACTLRAEEFLADCVTQPGPSVLFPLGE